MAITILAVGKKHESWIDEGVSRYEKRLKKPFDVTWVLLPHSSKEGPVARQEESGRILSSLKDDDYILLLDERGTMLDSLALSQRFESVLDHSQRIVIVIGGAYGVDERLFERADSVLSLSRLVFPHQLVRLILAEQLYRAQEIVHNSPYHHI